MKTILTILIVLMGILVFSCHKDKPVAADTTRTNFDIGSVHYASIKTTAYQTDFGQLLKVVGDNFELYIIMSDNNTKKFTIADSLTSSDKGKARCILKTSNDFKFSTSGTLEYDKDKKSGIFSANIEELNLKNGQIKVDTTINHPIIDFTSISSRDAQGNNMNQGDANDWGIRTNWDFVERLVFNLKTVNTVSSNIQMIAYPNPLNRIFFLSPIVPFDSKVDLYLVNANFEIEQKIKGLQFSSVGVHINNAVNLGNYYRLYYKIYSDSEQFYGSGDLNLQN